MEEIAHGGIFVAAVFRIFLLNEGPVGGNRDQI